MARGPLPGGVGGSGGGLDWLGSLLDGMLLVTPPIARLALAKHVRDWADKVERDAREQMGQRPPGPNDFASHGATHTTSGYETR